MPSQEDLEREMSRFRNKMKYSTSMEFVDKSSDYGQVDAYFHDVANRYDSDLNNPYWAFSHDLLKHLINTSVKNHFDETDPIHLFDAGGGTGNWSKYVLDNYGNSDAVLFDRNTSMLTVAQQKLRDHRLSIKYTEGNLEEYGDFPHQKPNLIFCFNCPIGFARDTEKVLENLYQHLETGGLALLTAPNKFHAFNFVCQTQQDQRELARIALDGTVKFKQEMPEIFCYTPQEFKDMILDAGFADVQVFGYPVTMYPEKGDTKHLKATTINDILHNPIFREQALALEKRLCLNPENAYKGGANLFAIAKKLPSNV